MQLPSIYECLRDPTRLRLLNLLQHAGPLCVCHLQSALQEPQVKISKHLGYLKRHGLVESRRDGHWMHYRIARHPSAQLARNLVCLQDCTASDPLFLRDLRRLKRGRDCASSCLPH